MNDLLDCDFCHPPKRSCDCRNTTHALRSVAAGWPPGIRTACHGPGLALDRTHCSYSPAAAVTFAVGFAPLSLVAGDPADRGRRSHLKSGHRRPRRSRRPRSERSNSAPAYRSSVAVFAATTVVWPIDGSSSEQRGIGRSNLTLPALLGLEPYGGDFPDNDRRPAWHRRLVL